MATRKYVYNPFTNNLDVVDEYDGTANVAVGTVNHQSLRWDVAANQWQPTTTLRIDSALYSPAAGITATDEGLLYWNATDKTLAINTNDGAFNIGQDVHRLVHNGAGAKIYAGDVVSVIGANGGNESVALTNATHKSSVDAFIGMVAVAEIDAGAIGRITSIGTVGGLDTSGMTAGLPVFVDPLNAGKLTQVLPDIPDYVIYVGVCTAQSATAGTIKINPRCIDTRVIDITSEPTGFTEAAGALEDIDVAYNDGDEKITLTGSFTGYYKAEKVAALISGWESDAHGAITSNRCLMYDGTAFTWSTTLDIDKLLIAFVIADSTGVRWAQRECHGLMQWQTHNFIHKFIGTARFSGGDLDSATYTLNSTTPDQRRPNTTPCNLVDEDLKSKIAQHLRAEGYTLFYLSGTNTINFATADAEIVRLAAAAQPSYQLFTGGAWTEVGMNNNFYAALFQIAIPTTSDAFSAKYRYIWVQPQMQSASLSTIQALTPNSISLGSLTSIAPEFVAINKVIIRYIGSNWRLIQVNSLQGTRSSQIVTPGGFLSAVTTDTTLTGDGSTIDPLSVSIIEAGTAEGQMTYWDHAATQWKHTETSELIWDDTNKRIGVGTTTPRRKLDALDDINPQIRATHTDNSVYAEIHADSAGILKINSTGNAIHNGSVTTDALAPDTGLDGAHALAAAAINITGGKLTIRGGAGASGSAGAAHGGDLEIGGGIAYGTGTAGKVVCLTDIAIRSDSLSLFFGASDSASVAYNGTDMIVNPKVAGSGILDIAGTLRAEQVEIGVVYAAPTADTHAAPKKYVDDRATTIDSTLTGTGVAASPLGINLANANTWTAKQTFHSADSLPIVLRGGLTFTPYTEPTAPTAALAGVAGNVDDGTHIYRVTFVTALGESAQSASSATITVVDKAIDGQVDLTDIAVSTEAGVTSRRIYRTKAGDTTYFLLATIADNTTTIYTDNTADASLTVQYLGSSADFNLYSGTSRYIGVDSLMTKLGFQCGLNNTGASFTGAGSNCGYQNTGVSFTGAGSNCGYQNTGVSFTGVGTSAGFRNTGVSFTGAGAQCGLSNTGASFTGVGAQCGLSNTGSSFTGAGLNCGYQNTGANFTGAGAQCGLSNTGSSFTGVGLNCGYQNTGANFTGAGAQCGLSNTGSSFTGVGLNCGYQNTGSSFTGVGLNCGYQNTGADNSFFGANAGRYIADGTTVRKATLQSIYVGSGSKALEDAANANENVYGYNAIGKGANSFVLGNTSTLTLWTPPTIHAGRVLTDTAPTAAAINGGAALAAAAINITGGKLTIRGGAGASGSAGAAHGGDLEIGGGIAYGTGAAGKVVCLTNIDVSGTLKASAYESSDGTAGATQDIILADGTISFKNGLFVSWAAA